MLWATRKRLREGVQKKKQETLGHLSKRGGGVRNLLKQSFFLEIVTLGGVELYMSQFPSLYFSIFNLFSVFFHSNFQYFP